MLDDLRAVIAHFRRRPGQKIFLLGQSWGAMLATSYVNRYPAEVNGIILSEPGGFTWNQVKDYVHRTQTLSPFSEAANDIFYLDQFITGNKNEHQALDYKMAINSAFDTREGNTLGNAGVYPFWRYGAVSNQALFGIAKRDGFDWTTHLNEFNKTVLFCYSELNKAYGPSYAQTLAAVFPDVQLEKINGSGHEITWFGFNQFYPLVKNYLHTH
jgi:proline iminopeptidase